MRPSALAFEDALASMLRGVRPLPSETLPLVRSLGRALSAPVASRVALPPWDNAGMDGYAVRREDVAGAAADAPVHLPVVATVMAGAAPADIPPLHRGVAMRIMTGAPLPPGADAVIRVEDTDGAAHSVRIDTDRDTAGRANVRPRGEEFEAGAELFPAGTSIGAAHLGVLASAGVASVAVHRRPHVALLSGGDELVLLDRFAEVEAGRRIVSSTTYALPPILESAGATVEVLPIAGDTLAATTRAIADALDRGIDLLVTTGGVSVGEHDHVKAALLSVGGAIEFWRARIRPGGPLGSGTIGAVPWLGLPGNPVSSMVTGWLFACPVIRQLGGHRRVHPRRLRVRMRDAAFTTAPLTHFLRVALRLGDDGVVEASLAGPQGSNLLRTMADADALLQVPEAMERVEPGALLEAILLPGGFWSEWSPGS